MIHCGLLTGSARPEQNRLLAGRFGRQIIGLGSDRTAILGAIPPASVASAWEIMRELNIVADRHADVLIKLDRRPTVAAGCSVLGVGYHGAGSAIGRARDYAIAGAVPISGRLSVVSIIVLAGAAGYSKAMQNHPIPQALEAGGW